MVLAVLPIASVALIFGASGVLGFDNSATDNLAVYWGQNSYGATHSSDTANWQTNLTHYCQDDTIDAIPMAFLNVFFGTGGEPSLDLSNICNVNDDAVFPNTQLPDCSFLASDIQTCQSKGKIVTMSLGGATGANGFSSDAQATEFATTIWNLLLGGSSDIRPFGNAVLDGIDLDIEGGSAQYYPTFVSALRTLMNGGSKTYYITGAPQCPFPDAYLGSVINAEGFDALYVQFYNNYCGLQNYDNANDWNFDQWDSWAKSTSPNKNVKIYIGAPASSTAAGSGYVDAATLGSIAQAMKAQYSSFGGVMLWDASQAYANNRYDQAIKSYLTGGSSAPTSTSSGTTTSAPTSTTTTTTSTASTSTTTTPSGSCGSLSAWVANVAYTAGDQVLYNGDVWTANQWNYAETPGGSSGAWDDNGPCANTAAKAGPVSAAKFTMLTTTVTSRSTSTPEAVKVVVPVVQTNVPAKRSRLFQF
ncbi:glycoside hydrolase [Gloeophyllum trabeum ATCC 11539]|uniref:chitinase n=1 Tax=Gloeophyllum trabeum (strain ATCC 11539 / FP-39264 / Madison 617) TaxID=670483 RepID=S7RNJ0_GLOTA|nr:glycoside hydrolase [Gloeophyllum trabeum ATCC 11539]EPQ54334.1 glycoside hydrolase [Gloeophyllum trabeum ATCC 11539]